MNPAIAAALMAANKQSEAQDPVPRLTEAGANDAHTAIKLDVASPTEQRQIDSAIGNGLITRHYSGRLYVNQRAVADYNQSVGYALSLALFIAASLIASVVALIAFDS